MHEAWIQISDEITVGEQPDPKGIESLANSGFQTVVNLRTPDEEFPKLSIEDERKEVRGHGMVFHHIPVSMDKMAEEQVDKFSQSLAHSPLPAFVHCKGGQRAGAFSLMHLALERGWTGDQALHIAKQMGFECDNDEMRKFVKEYINEQRGTKAGRTDG